MQMKPYVFLPQCDHGLGNFCRFFRAAKVEILQSTDSDSENFTAHMTAAHEDEFMIST
jgi:hypothetical protein